METVPDLPGDPFAGEGPPSVWALLDRHYVALDGLRERHPAEQRIVKDVMDLGEDIALAGCREGHRKCSGGRRGRCPQR